MILKVILFEKQQKKEDFTFAGYLTDSNNLLINNTLGTSTLALQDYDKDGLLDRYERQVSLSDPENEDTDGDGKMTVMKSSIIKRHH